MHTCTRCIRVAYPVYNTRGFTQAAGPRATARAIPAWSGGAGTRHVRSLHSRERVSDIPALYRSIISAMSVVSEKDKRYDRQLRLWGDHGQAALEAARVCLLNATVTGTEILKNLILPGVGWFTIVDNAKVTTLELGSNFFVTADDLGKSRAECVVRSLQMLNDIKGDYIEEDIEDVVQANPDFFTKYTIVIATGLSQATLSRIARLLWCSSIPLLVSRSYGLLGFIRIALPDHQIVESHPDNYHEDLRLDCPFVDLAQFMATIDLNELDNTQHSNVPYLVILYKYLQQWKQNHDGMIPQNYHEKRAFKECIRSGIRCNDNSVPFDEENFDEAIQNVNCTIIPYKIPSEIQDILDSPLCTSTSPKASAFWLLARALREFVVNEGHGRLPVRGSIPDMTSTSSMYIDLSRVYQSRAQQDKEAIKNHLNQILLSLGKSCNYISEEEVSLFCRNSAFLRVLKYRSIEEELENPDGSTLSTHLENSESDVIYYVLVRAAEQFYGMYHFYPGDGVEGIEADVVKLKLITASLLQKWQLSAASIHDDHVTEFCRYGAGEVHSVAAFVGGVAAQEVIKIITHQFVPLNNTLIYNAATASTLTVTV